MIEHEGSAPLLFHDYFAIRGGGERLVLELARDLAAELVYGYKTPDSYGPEDFPDRSRSLHFDIARRVPGLATIALATRFAAERGKSSRRSIRIFSGVAAPFAAPGRDKSGLNIFYCHTPPRFLYDQKDFYRTQGGLLRRVGLAAVGPIFQQGYERAVGNMDVIVANSANIQRRIKTYLGRDSVVVYPPVDTEGFRWQPSEGYYLSTARLTPLKRIRAIVEAFLRMPDRRLVVASGGEQENELRQMAGNAPNIHFTGWIDDAELKQWVAGAIATIYIPIEEDFGMSPVESMAAGKPVLGVSEGGLLETIVSRQTGLLIPANPTTDDVEAGVRWLTPEVALEMREACEQRAQLFKRARFLSAMRSVIAEATSSTT